MEWRVEIKVHMAEHVGNHKGDTYWDETEITMRHAGEKNHQNEPGNDRIQRKPTLNNDRNVPETRLDIEMVAPETDQTLK